MFLSFYFFDKFKVQNVKFVFFVKKFSLQKTSNYKYLMVYWLAQ